MFASINRLYVYPQPGQVTEVGYSMGNYHAWISKGMHMYTNLDRVFAWKEDFYIP
jgi:hypothetical protein